MNEFTEKELLAPGHKTCAGCGEVIGIRQILRATGKNIVFCAATGCMEITTTCWPETSWKVPWLHMNFENTAAAASGVARALKTMGKEDVTVLAVGGDGGMADIGFQAISGALERGENMLIIMTDNEAYANTGMQRSGETPMFASTATAPAGKKRAGKEEWKKPMVEICAAHGIQYAASASIAFHADFENKIKKAMKIHGPKFIQVHTTCPVGWLCNEARSVEVAKLAVDTGLWVLFEIEDGKYKVNYKPEKLRPVKDYLSLQGRFVHLDDAHIAEIQKRAQAQYERILSKEKC